MTWRLAGSTSLAAVTFVMSACASAGGAGGASCSSDLSPSSRSLNDVLDSADVQNRLAAAWPAGASRTVARIRSTADEPNQVVQVWSRALPQEGRATLEALLEPAAATLREQDAPAYLFLGDEAGPALRLVDELARCAPTVRQESQLERRIAGEARGLGLTQRRVVWLFLWVEEDGSVGEVRVDESSGDTRVDLAAARVFRTASFTPATLAGVPIRTGIRLPVTFTPRGS